MAGDIGQRAVDAHELEGQTYPRRRSQRRGKFQPELTQPILDGAHSRSLPARTRRCARRAPLADWMRVTGPPLDPHPNDSANHRPSSFRLPGLRLIGVVYEIYLGE